MNYVFVQFALSESVSSQSLAAFDSRNPKFWVLLKEGGGALRGLGEACAAAGLAEGALKSGVGLSRASSCHRPHLFLELRPLTALCSGSYWLPTLLFPGQNWYFLNCAISSILPAHPQPSPQPFSSVSRDRNLLCVRVLTRPYCSVEGSSYSHSRLLNSSDEKGIYQLFLKPQVDPGSPV